MNTSTKCYKCNKKLHFIHSITMKCKCGNIYCNKHINNSNHDCNYNYYVDYIIKNNLPKLEQEKLNKI